MLQKKLFRAHLIKIIINFDLSIADVNKLINLHARFDRAYGIRVRYYAVRCRTLTAFNDEIVHYVHSRCMEEIKWLRHKFSMSLTYTYIIISTQDVTDVNKFNI